MNSRKKDGFTLMEMLIVVAIIGILVAVAIPTFSGALERTRAATCAANRRSLKGLLSVTYMMEGKDAADAMYSAHEAEYTCPSGGKIDCSIGDGIVTVTCTLHTSKDMAMLETFADYAAKYSDTSFQNTVKQELRDSGINPGGTNDNLRKYYYLKHGGWPTFQMDGATLYVQPYVDAGASGKLGSQDTYLFANGNSGTGGSWNAKYFYSNGTWYVSKTGKSFPFANAKWSDIQEKLEPMKSPPNIT